MEVTSSRADTGNYDVIVKERNDRYYLYIPELNIIVDDVNIAAGYDKLTRAKSDLIEKYAMLGMDAPPNRDQASARRMRTTLLPFFLKCAAVAATGSVLIIAAAIGVNYATKQPLQDAAQRAGRAAIERVVRGLEKVGRDGLSSDREERLRTALRSTVPVLKPFVQELRPLFTDDDTAPTAKPHQNH